MGGGLLGPELLWPTGGEGAVAGELQGGRRKICGCWAFVSAELGLDCSGWGKVYE